MQFWSIVRYVAGLVRVILLPRWIREGRLSHRLAVGLTLLLLFIELLPTENPLKQEAHRVYTAGAATVAGTIDATWRPRLQAAVALGDLRAELDRLYWLEAETTVMYEHQLARQAHVEAQIAAHSGNALDLARRAAATPGPNGPTRSYQQATSELAALEQELQHVQQMAAYYATTAQQTTSLRLEAEAGRQRLLDYLEMLDTTGAYANPGAEAAAVELLRDEFDRRRRIILERSRLESHLAESPLR